MQFGMHTKNLDCTTFTLAKKNSSSFLRGGIYYRILTTEYTQKSNCYTALLKFDFWMDARVNARILYKKFAFPIHFEYTIPFFYIFILFGQNSKAFCIGGAR